MVKINKFLLFICGLFFLITQSYAQDLDNNSEEIYNFDIKTPSYQQSIGFSLKKLNGRSDEIVLDGTKKLSHLEWDLRDIRMLAVDYQIKFDEDYSGMVRFANSIDHGSKKGRMVDSDWIGVSYDGNIDHENWTHRSFSAIKMQRAQNFRVQGSYHLFSDLFRFNIGYNYDTFKWRDYGGDYIYTNNSFRDTKGNFGGVRGISYQQYFNTPYIGLEYQKELFNKTIFFNIFGNYSKFVKAKDVDTHHLRNIKFYEYFNNGEYFNWGLNINTKIVKSLSFGVGYEYTYYPLNRGYTIIEKNNIKYITYDSAGIRNKYSTISLNLKYNFESKIF